MNATRIPNCKYNTALSVINLLKPTNRCGGDIGVFLVIKKCIVLLLHNQNGAFMNPPYLDSHGEVDLGIRYVAI